MATKPKPPPSPKPQQPPPAPAVEVPGHPSVPPTIVPPPDQR